MRTWCSSFPYPLNVLRWLIRRRTWTLFASASELSHSWGHFRSCFCCRFNRLLLCPCVLIWSEITNSPKDAAFGFRFHGSIDCRFGFLVGCENSANGPENEARESFKCWWSNCWFESHQSVSKLAERCLSFRSIAKWICGKVSREAPLAKPAPTSVSNTCKSPLYMRTAFIQNDLSIKVTSCKGRGSCCYFFYFSCSTPTHRSEPTNLQRQWMWFDWFSHLLLSSAYTRWSLSLEVISACTNTNRRLLGSIRNIFFFRSREEKSIQPETGFISCRWIISAWIFSARFESLDLWAMKWIEKKIDKIADHDEVAGNFTEAERGMRKLWEFLRMTL